MGPGAGLCLVLLMMFLSLCVAPCSRLCFYVAGGDGNGLIKLWPVTSGLQPVLFIETWLQRLLLDLDTTALTIHGTLAPINEFK